MRCPEFSQLKRLSPWDRGSESRILVLVSLLLIPDSACTPGINDLELVY